MILICLEIFMHSLFCDSRKCWRLSRRYCGGGKAGSPFLWNPTLHLYSGEPQKQGVLHPAGRRLIILIESFIQKARRVLNYHFYKKLVRKANTYRLQLGASRKIAVKLHIIQRIFFSVPFSILVDV